MQEPSGVDAKAVMERLRREVYGEDGAARTEIPRSLYEGARQLSLLQHLDGNPPIGSYSAKRAWLVVPVKKFLGKLSKWYVKPLAEKISERNRIEADVIHGLLRQIERLEREIRERAPAGSAESVRTAEGDAGRTGRFPDWYFGLEDRIRGSSETVAELWRNYLPLWKEGDRVLDLGCGRGEFLELLRQEGIEAEGVDIDPDMVSYCQERGLQVAQADLFERLEQQDNESLDGIFCAQVVEHLSPQEVLDLVAEAYSRLKRGGVLVVETLNPACLTIFSGAFYADPTHRRPVHPEVLRYFFERTGFSGVDAWYSNPVPEEARLEKVPEGTPGEAHLNRNIEKLNSVLYGYAHYAVLGRRV